MNCWRFLTNQAGKAQKRVPLSTLLEVVLDFQPVCSLVNMDQGFISGCSSHRFRFAFISLIRGQYVVR